MLSNWQTESCVSGEVGSFFEDTMKIANELGIVDVQSLEKSELKKKIKTAMKTKM